MYDFNFIAIDQYWHENTVDPDQMLPSEDNRSRSTVFSYSFVLFNNLENPDKLI